MPRCPACGSDPELLAQAQIDLKRVQASLDCAQENFHVTNQAYIKADAELAQAQARCAELAQVVWGNWISQYDPMNEDGAYGCVYCDVRFESPVDWAKVKHDPDCIVNRARDAALKEPR